MDSRIYPVALIALTVTMLAGCGGEDGSGVLGGQTEQHDVVLAWQPATTNIDGSCTDDLDAYTFRYGLSPGFYDRAQRVSADQVSCQTTGETTACGAVQECRYRLTLQGESSASWYLVVQAMDTGGNASSYSNEVVFTAQ
jgi:hypothetical protein